MISDNQTNAVKLPAGHPRHVRILDHYAFVNIYGAGLAVIDLEGMTIQSDRTNLNAVLRFHYEDFINDVAVYKRLVKDPDSPPDEPGKDQIVAVILVDYFGIKMLDINQQENEDPVEPFSFSKYQMKWIGNYQFPERTHL